MDRNSTPTDSRDVPARGFSSRRSRVAFVRIVVARRGISEKKPARFTRYINRTQPRNRGRHEVA